ncbi:MAG: 6-phosphogluconolactonase [Clostridiales bacterium]|jgi:glucosamine-6-phosphate deaminase|nr:6-phosphogluconolactonase [Clostridiales bacterium]
MNIVICQCPKALGLEAARRAAERLREAAREKGRARMVVSTGASQLDTFEALLKQEVDWSRVELFHLDEYINLPETHKASFRKYLKERFIDRVNLGGVFLVNGTREGIAPLTKALREAPVDVGLIGIGENAHIAFNDPPADFDTREAYHVVTLDDTCKNQQVREGWFDAAGDVPDQAVSMTVYQIMQCKAVFSCVPYAVKACAVGNMLRAKNIDPGVPASILKTHADYTLLLDRDSSALVNEGEISALNGVKILLEKPL